MSSSTSTSLTLRALLKTTAGRLGLGVPGRGVSGLTPPAKAFFAAAAAGRGHVILVAPTDADVEQLTSDARFFLAALEGLSDTEAAHVVLPFPSHEIDPYRGLSPHFDIASARARALHAISVGSARLIVASAASLLPRLTPPARFKETGFALRPGDDISPIDLGDRLAAAGYTRQDPTDEPGEFSVRGGVVDLYAAGARMPVRLEFIGDTIESVRTYDPATQRSVEAIDQVHVVPLIEILRPSISPTDRPPSAIISPSSLPSFSSPNPTKYARRSRSNASKSNTATQKRSAKTSVRSNPPRSSSTGRPSNR
jgi:transcription-repair coupling factor (superfamily II helicase)